MHKTEYASIKLQRVNMCDTLQMITHTVVMHCTYDADFLTAGNLPMSHSGGEHDGTFDIDPNPGCLHFLYIYILHSTRHIILPCQGRDKNEKQ